MCRKCKIEKDCSLFYKDSSKKDLLTSYCKECAISQGIIIKSKNAQSIILQKKDYYIRNKEAILKRNRAWRESNKEMEKVSSKKWAEDNRDKRSASCRNRRALKRSSGGTHSASDVLTIFNSQRGLCANCKTQLFKTGKQKYHVDHIMPIALGGCNWPSNLQCLCPKCNLSKGSKHPAEWAAENGRLI